MVDGMEIGRVYSPYLYGLQIRQAYIEALKRQEAERVRLRDELLDVMGVSRKEEVQRILKLLSL